MFIKRLAFYVMETLWITILRLEMSIWVGGQMATTLTAQYSCSVQEVLLFTMWLRLVQTWFFDITEII